jgi:hypothetical protein
MADTPDDGPSLEMPSFSLRRKKKQAPEEDVTSEAAPEATPEATAVEPEPAPEAAAAEPAPEPEPVHQPLTVQQPTVQQTTVLPVSTPEPDPEPVAHDQALEPAPAEPKRRLERPSVSLPGLPAAAVTGVVVGGLAVLLAWVAGTACSAVRGTSSCGGAVGLPLLLVGLALLAYAGSILLRVFAVPAAGSTSLLAVGILAVLVLVLLLGSLDEWWAVVTVPVAAVVAFCGSWWVTTVVVGDEPEPTGARTPYDVR